MPKIAMLLFLCALAIPLRAQESDIPWMTDLAAAQRQAALENKLVLVHFWGTFCRPCINVEKFVFTNPRVASAINESYIPVKIDVENNPGLAKQFGITTIPHDIVLSPMGKVVAKQASSTNSDGYLRMVQNVAHKAARMNPTAIAAAEQIAESMPEGLAQVEPAFLPAGQSSVIPEALNNIGNAANPVDQQIRTVAGEIMMPAGRDDRKLSSVPHSQQFVDQLRLLPSPNNAAGTEVSPPAASPIPQVLPANARSQILRPMTTPLPQSDPLPEVSPSMSAAPIGGYALDTLSVSVPRQEVSTPPQIIAQATPSAATPSGRLPTQIPLGFNGACPTTWYTTGEFVPGKSEWGCEHRGRLYLFASRELRDRFLLSPDELSPALAGYDPVTYALTGDLQDGCLEHFVEINSGTTKTIYLFATAENKSTFETNPTKYVDEARQALRAADQPVIR